MEDDRSISPSSLASSHEEHDSDLHDIRTTYPATFNPLWFPYTPLRHSQIFNSIPFQPTIRAVTPVVRHNFKSIDELLSPIPHSVTSTPSQRNDDTGYSSQLLSGSLLSLRQSRTSIDSQENEDDLENIKPTNSSSPIVEVKKANDDSKNSKNKKIRTAFTDHQKLSLDRFYATNRYPDPTQMETLSRLLSLEEKVIRVWFQNKRSREKNHPRQQLPIHQQPTNPTDALAMWQQISSSPNFLH